MMPVISLKIWIFQKMCFAYWCFTSVNFKFIEMIVCRLQLFENGEKIGTDRQTFSFSSFPIPIKSNLTFQLIFQDSIKLTWCISIWWIISIQVDVIKSSVVGRCLKMMKRNGRNRLPKCLIAGDFDCSLIVLAIDTEIWNLQSTCSIYWNITSIIYRYME